MLYCIVRKFKGGRRQQVAPQGKYASARENRHPEEVDTRREENTFRPVHFSPSSAFRLSSLAAIFTRDRVFIPLNYP